MLLRAEASRSSPAAASRDLNKRQGLRAARGVWLFPSMDKDIKSAVDYVMLLMDDKSIPPDALRLMVEDRIRMACADTLRWQAIQIQTAAGNLTARK